MRDATPEELKNILSKREKVLEKQREYGLNRLGCNPVKTINITSCLFLKDKACVTLKCVYNINSNHIAIYQTVTESWDVDTPIPSNPDITVIRKRWYSRKYFTSDGRVLGTVKSTRPLTPQDHVHEITRIREKDLATQCRCEEGEDWIDEDEEISCRV